MNWLMLNTGLVSGQRKRKANGQEKENLSMSEMPLFGREIMDTHKTPVIFKQHDDGEIFAAFPQELGNYDLSTMQGYAHFGQHGAYTTGFVSEAKPAMPEQYKDLFDELTGLGYNLLIRRKLTKFDQKIREKLLQEIRGEKAS
jgi:hypothetical protein